MTFPLLCTLQIQNPNCAVVYWFCGWRLIVLSNKTCGCGWIRVLSYLRPGRWALEFCLFFFLGNRICFCLLHLLFLFSAFFLFVGNRIGFGWAFNFWLGCRWSCTSVWALNFWVLIMCFYICAGWKLEIAKFLSRATIALFYIHKVLLLYIESYFFILVIINILSIVFILFKILFYLKFLLENIHLIWKT